jgi:hypothetical protein
MSFSSTMRTLGSPWASTVASAMAFASSGSLRVASASQARAMAKGSSPANMPPRSVMSFLRADPV